MVPTSLPGGRPRGMVRVSPRMPREAMWSRFGVRAYSSGVFPPSSAIGSSAIPSPWRTTYFIAITALGVCLSNRGERGEGAGERERQAQRRPTRRAWRHAAGGRSEHAARSPRIVCRSRHHYPDGLLGTAMLRALLLAAVLAPAALAGETTRTEAVGLRFAVPAAWTRVPASSEVRAAQWRLPRATGDAEDGEAILFFFGAGKGGGAAENL